MNTTSFISRWQFKIKCFFYLLCCSTNRKHTQNIYIFSIEQTQLTSRKKLSLLVATMYQRSFDIKTERGDAVEKEFFAIHLIWSLDVVLRTFEDDSLVWFAVSSHSNQMTLLHSPYPYPMNFHFSFKMLRCREYRQKRERQKDV